MADDPRTPTFRVLADLRAELQAAERTAEQRLSRIECLEREAADEFKMSADLRVAAAVADRDQLIDAAFYAREMAALLDEWMIYGELSAGGMYGTLRARTQKAIDRDAALAGREGSDDA